MKGQCRSATDHVCDRDRLSGDAQGRGGARGAWVPLLEAESLCHLDARKVVELDFAGVSFIDREGVAMMRNLITSGVQVWGASALVNALLSRSAVS